MSTEQLNIKAVVSLQHIVRNYIIERGLNMSSYRRLLQMAVRGFSHLNMTELRSVSHHYATPNQAGQIFMPPDFVDYAKVGYFSGEEFFAIGINKDLKVNTDNGSVSVEQAGESSTSDSYILTEHYYGSRFVPTMLFGYRGEYPGQSFNVDYDNKIIQVSSMVPRRELCIEYISTGVSLNGNTYVPRNVEEAVIEWLYWRDLKGSANGNATRGMIDDAKQDFLEQLNILRDQDMPTLQEVYDVLYSTAMQAPQL